LKTTKILIAVVSFLALFCVSLFGYILYEYFTQSERNTFCIPHFSTSDLTWEVMNFGYEGYLDWNHAFMPFIQSHWGENEFVILDTAINSFVSFEEDFVPPWEYYRPTWWESQWQERQWWDRRMWHERGVEPSTERTVRPFDIIFQLFAGKEAPQLIDAFYDPWMRLVVVEEIQFLFSETYGAFAITYAGNIPRGAYCFVRNPQFFHVDVDAFFSLFEIIEYECNLLHCLCRWEYPMQ